MKHSTSAVSNVCARVQFEYAANRDWEQWMLVTADWHLENPHTRRDLIKLHLSQAKERGAAVLVIGDLFDAMQGKHDRRANKGDILPELIDPHVPYLDKLVDYAHGFIEPYSEHVALLTDGNHETSVESHTETNLLARLADKLGSLHMGYRGYIQFQFRPTNDTRKVFTRTGYYHHGSGGGGPVTKGVIQTNRRAVYLPDADFVLSGHIHEQWTVKVVRSRLLKSGREVIDSQQHVQLPTYKDEFAGEPGGFHHERGRPPKPLGAWWCRFYYSPREERIKEQWIEAEI